VPVDQHVYFAGVRQFHNNLTEYFNLVFGLAPECTEAENSRRFEA